MVITISANEAPKNFNLLSIIGNFKSDDIFFNIFLYEQNVEYKKNISNFKKDINFQKRLL